MTAARRRLSVMLTQVGELMFASTDEEARWRAWDIQVRHAGLGRAYRDRRFDARVPCRYCRRTGAGADGSACADCSMAGRIVAAV